MKYIKLTTLVVCAVILASCTAGEPGKKTDVGHLTDGHGSDIHTSVVFDGEDAEIDGDGAALENNTLTIKEGGSYTLSGDFKGNITVDISKDEKAELVLRDLTVMSKDTAAIYIRSADKVTVTLEKGTENTLTDGEDYALEDDAEPSACLYSADDLTIRGEGELFVYAKCRNGIQTKNDLRIKDGNITVSAPKNALKGKDNVEISGGVITVTGASDAIKSDNEKEEGRGNVIITGGNITITCLDDAIQAYRSVHISDCTIKADAGDDIINCDGEAEIDEDCFVNE